MPRLVNLVDPEATVKGRGTRPRRVKPQVVGLSVPSVVDAMEASAGEPWVLVLVVARWIMRLGTVRDRSRVGNMARVVVDLATVTAVPRQDISVGIVPSHRVDRTRTVERQTSRARTGVIPPHQECTSCLRTRTRLNRSRLSLVKPLDLSFQFNSIAWYGI